MFRQFAPGRWVDRVADFLGAGRSRGNLKLIGRPRFFHQILHDKFRHGAAADITVAYEKYIFHKVSSLYFSRLFYYSTFSPFRQSGAVNLWYFPAGVIFFGRNSVFMLDFRNFYCYNEGTN